MATGLQKWSQTAAANANIDTSVNWAEGQAPSSINDSARAVMASAAKWRDDNNGTLVTTGSSAAFSATTNQGSTGLINGYTVTLNFHATADTSATYTHDTFGPAALQLVSGTNLSGGEIVAGSIHRFTYVTTSTAWIKQGHEALVISDGFVTGTMIADATVKSTNLVDSTIATTKIADANITTAKIADSAVTTAKINDGAVTAAKLSASGSLYVTETQSANTATSCANTSGAWTVAVLNTTNSNTITSASRTNNVISLPAGTYRVIANLPFGSNGGTARLRLYNTTDSATALINGSNSANSGNASGTTTWCMCNGVFVIAGTKSFQFEFYCSSKTSATPNDGDSNIYLNAIVEKIA